MIKLFTSDLKMLVRNRQLIFWSFAFPLIFTVIFGFFYSGGGKSNIGTALYVDEAHTQLSSTLRNVLSHHSPLTVQDCESETEARALISTGKAVGAVIVPAGFGVWPPSKPVQAEVLYDSNSPAGKAALDGVVGGFATTVSFRAQNVQPLYTVADTAVGSHTHSYFDYVLIGLLGMSLMNSAIMGLAISMSYYRETQILKRIAITPLPQWRFMLAEVTARLVINAAQVLIILAVGIYGFHAQIDPTSMAPLLALAIIGAFMFQMIGFSIAAVTKTSDAAQGMAQAITVPMMFLGGVFFSADGLPTWLQSIVKFLPLAPLLRMMRAVSLDHGRIFAQPSDIAIVLGWIAAMAFVVISRFRLAEEYQPNA